MKIFKALQESTRFCCFIREIKWKKQLLKGFYETVLENILQNSQGKLCIGLCVDPQPATILKRG